MTFNINQSNNGYDIILNMEDEIQEIEMVTINKQEYESMKLQIQYLQTQLLIYRHPLENLKCARNQSSLNNRMVIPGCEHCGAKKSIISPTIPKSIPQIKQEWSEWSNNLKIKIKQPKPSIKHQQQIVVVEQKKNNLKDNQKDKPSWIEAICVFGPKQSDMINSPHKSFSVPHQMYSSIRNKKYQFHGTYLYPQDVSVKLIRQEKVALEVNRIVFKKNCKRQDTSVIILPGDKDHLFFKENAKYDEKLLKQCNPSKRLYIFSVHFSDFIIMDIDDSSISNNNNSVDEKLSSLKNIDDPNQTANRSNFQTNQIIRAQSNSKALLSKFTISIFTYFPLVNLMEKILLLLMDQIKIKRIQSYSKSNYPNNLDIRYFIKEFQVVVGKMMNEIQKIPPMLNQKGKLKIGDSTIEINFVEEWIKNQMFNGWAAPIAKFLNKETMYQLFCHIIFEESLCIVCEDLYFLTYFILLFVDFMIQPLIYPHPLVSIAFKEELLGSPFTIVLGINKTTKWLEQNLDLISESKITIDLNEQYTIKSKKKIKTYKCEKLRKIFSNFYKKLQPNTPTLFTSKKREPILKSSSFEQDILIKQLIMGIRAFVEEQIVFHLPNNEIISHMMTQKSTSKNNIEIKNAIISAIEKYFMESRKQKEKDFLIDNLVKQQTFYAFICQRYHIQ